MKIIRFRKTALALVMAAVFLVGCGKKEEPADINAATAATAEPALSKPAAANKTLAYEHELNLNVSEEAMPKVFNGVKAACLAEPDQGCTELSSSIRTGDYPSASIKLRAKPESVQKIVKGLSQQGRIVSQNSHAEDLSHSLADNAKKIQMLRDYRTQLEELRKQTGKDVETLMKVSKELAEVQSNIEALEGKQAGMVQRVQTELLTISMSVEGAGHQRSEVKHALAAFGANFSSALASAITAIAYMLPWAGLLVVVWVIISQWRQRRKRLQNKDQNS